MFGIIFDGHPALTGSSCPTTGRATPSLRTTPSAASVEYKGATIPPPDRRSYT